MEGAFRPINAEIGTLTGLIEDYLEHTASPVAALLLEDAARLAEEFWLVVPGSDGVAGERRVPIEVELGQLRPGHDGSVSG